MIRGVELQPITDADLQLYESILCDPAMMSELGGPLPREGLAEKLRRDVASVEAGEARVFKIVPDGAGAAAGTVSVWDHSWRGETISEIGWMVLTGFQGSGLGSAAVRTAIEMARTERRWDVLHAFPGTSNAPSNAICRKAGFSMIEECDFEYSGRTLRCNHWRLDLRADEATRPSPPARPPPAETGTTPR